MQNLGCYSVSKLELRIHLPSVAAGGRVFMNVTEVFSYNVSNDTKYITWKYTVQFTLTVTLTLNRQPLTRKVERELVTGG